MVGTSDACGEGPVLRGGRGTHHGVMRSPGPRAPFARHGSLLPGPSEAAGTCAPPIGLHGGRWAGVARPRGLAVAGPAREDGRWHDSTGPRHGRQPGSLAPATRAKARPGVSYSADGRVDLLGHGRLVRAGDRTVQ